MPYISDSDRVDWDDALEELFIEMRRKPGSPGELNYLLTKIVSQWLTEKGLSYTHINDVIGVLECVKQEFYRRITAPYEDTKAAENGDVYPDYLKTPRR